MKSLRWEQMLLRKRSSRRLGRSCAIARKISSDYHLLLTVLASRSLFTVLVPPRERERERGKRLNAHMLKRFFRGSVKGKTTAEMKRERTAERDGKIKTFHDWVDQSYEYSGCVFGRLVFSFSFFFSFYYVFWFLQWWTKNGFEIYTIANDTRDIYRQIYMFVTYNINFYIRVWKLVIFEFYSKMLNMCNSILQNYFHCASYFVIKLIWSSICVFLDNYIT